jgi:hypothetical protein
LLKPRVCKMYCDATAVEGGEFMKFF